MKRSCTTILIVDDEENVRDILAEHLTNEYCRAVTARSPFEALNRIKRQPFSLIISDMVMPGMSGIDLLRFIKKHDPEIPVIMITGITDLNTAVDCLRLGACDYITKPFNLPVVRRSVDRALERRQLLVESRYYQVELEKKIQARTQELNGALSEIKESYKITLEALVTALDAREHETQAHSQRVREYTSTLAEHLGLTGEDLVHVGRGALLHDVGKIGVPDSILLKPGKLTSEEWVEMKKHPQIGHEILQSIEFLAPAAEIVLAHQERFDGKGYPFGRAGEDIPMGARIFAVVDTLDAMTSNRPYRRGLTWKEAREEIRRYAGTQFDPKVVDAFLSVPAETWMAIHESVNRLHRTEQSFDLLCQT